MKAGRTEDYVDETSAAPWPQLDGVRPKTSPALIDDGRRSEDGEGRGGAKYNIRITIVTRVKCGKLRDLAYKYRAVMTFLTSEKQYAKLQTTFMNVRQMFMETVSPSCATIPYNRWVAEFKRGRTWLEDDHRAGRPVEVTTDDCCHAVEILMMGVGDRRVRSCR